MTYCIGLRTDKGVLIAADSAISSPVRWPWAGVDEATTSFGERQGDVGPRHRRYVYEEGLKLAVGDGTVVGFAGDVSTAEELIRAYFNGRAAGMKARDAVRGALVSVTPCKGNTDVLFAFYEDSMPYLQLVNTTERSIRDVEGLIQIGIDLSAGQHEWTNRYVKQCLYFLEQFDSDPRHTKGMFTVLVALMQSYGVHDYLLQHGIGGACVAAWVTPTGARWQGDNLYVIHGETPAFNDTVCATMIRDDVLCLVNNQTKSTKLVTRARPGESPHDTMARSKAASAAGTAAFDDGTFDYFISINRSKRIVVVVEMLRHQHHDLLSLHSTQFECQLGVVWTQKLITYANTFQGEKNPGPHDMAVRFIPFRALSAEEQGHRMQFAWESFVDRVATT